MIVRLVAHWWGLTAREWLRWKEEDDAVIKRASFAQQLTLFAGDSATDGHFSSHPLNHGQVYWY